MLPILLSLVVLHRVCGSFAGSIYRVVLNESASGDALFGWREVVPVVENPIAHAEVTALLQKNVPMNSTAEFFSRNKPVVVSITTIASRVKKVYRTILTILCGKAAPTKIILFISETGFLIDGGIPVEAIPQELLALVAANMLTIVYTDNIGPHRKLLPILDKANKLNANFHVINIDDDMGTVDDSETVYQLMKAFTRQQAASTGELTANVVAMRARRIGFCAQQPHYVTKYTSWPVQNSIHERPEMLLLPTGTGGILYQSDMFHPIVFSESFRNLTSSADDITFRLATMVNRVKVILGCSHTYSSDNQKKDDNSFNRCRPNKLDAQFEKAYQSVGKCSSLQMRLRLKKAVNANEERQEDEDDDEETSLNDQSGDLYSINRKRKNDLAWHAAIRFLSKKKLIDWSRFVDEHLEERGEACLSNRTDAIKAKSCALWPCRSNKTG